MPTINRAVLLVRPKDACKQWVESVLPHLRRPDDPGAWPTRVFLVAQDPKGLAESAPLRKHDSETFTGELASWVDDETLWPRRRDMKRFLEWIDVEATAAQVVDGYQLSDLWVMPFGLPERHRVPVRNVGLRHVFDVAWLELDQTALLEGADWPRVSVANLHAGQAHVDDVVGV